MKSALRNRAMHALHLLLLLHHHIQHMGGGRPASPFASHRLTDMRARKLTKLRAAGIVAATYDRRMRRRRGT